MSGKKPMLPPLPRDHDQASFSELVPFRSTKIKLWKSPLFFFVLITAVVTVALFGIMDVVASSDDAAARQSAFTGMTYIIMGYLLMLVLFAAHSYARTDKPVYFLVFPFVLVIVVLMSPVWTLIFTFFHKVLPGSEEAMKSTNFATAWLAAFCGPGLGEEFTKAIPTLIAAAFTLFAATLRRTVPAWFWNMQRVRGPLDAVLMGLAAGGGFILLETGSQYVPNAVHTAFQQTHNPLLAYGYGLMLLLPRVINGMVGHMAYSGIFAYFIGLAVIRRKHAVMLLAIGWVVAAVLHGTWDAVNSQALYYVVAGISGVLLIACLLKARQLEASTFGRSAQTFGSIVVDRSTRAPMPFAMPPPPPPSPYPGAAAPHPAPVPVYQPAPPPPYAAPPAPPPPAPAPAPYAAPPPAPPPYAQPPAPAPQAATASLPGVLALAIGTHLVPLLPGKTVDLGADAALEGRGNGIRGEVTRHPTNPNVFGFKNLGDTTWYARLRDNSVQPVDPQRNLRLAAGVRIDFGGGLVAQVIGG